MKKLKNRINTKKKIWKTYQKLLQNTSGITIFNHDLEHTTPWFIDVVVSNRSDLMKHLKSNDIGTRVMYPPIHSQKCYDIKGEYPVSQNIGHNGLWLPSHVKLENSDINFICKTINDFYL